MSVSNSLRFRVLARDNFTCRYCGRSAPDVVLEVDHVRPVSAGGPDTEQNLVASCFDCNRAKGPKPVSVGSAVVSSPASPPLITGAATLVGNFFLRPHSVRTCEDCAQEWPQLQQGIIAQAIGESHILCIPFSWWDGSRLAAFVSSVEAIIAEQWELYPATDQQIAERFFRRCAAHLREHDHHQNYDPPSPAELEADFEWARGLLASLRLAPPAARRPTSKRSNVTA